jgi:hypothetical protein
MTPKIMSGPKATSFQHYLTQQEPDTVDIGTRTRGGDPKTATLLDHYASPPPHETVIRGHKRYWHQAETTQARIEETATVDFAGDERQRPPKLPDSQHTQIKPVKPGVTFQFRLHFENLRDFELGALLWALALPGEEGKTYCHKLGMGKALGMGSIRLTLSALKISKRPERYETLFSADQWYLPEEEQTQQQGQYLAAFVTRMRGQEGRDLHEDERIRMLLKLLEYPGLQHERTRYMELGGFRERPVLPDPLHVAQRLGRGLAFPLTKIHDPEEQALPVITAPLYSTDAAERAPSLEGQAIAEQLKQRLAGVTATLAHGLPTAVEASTLVAKTPQSKDDFVPGAYLQVTVKDVQFNAILCDTGVKEITARLEEKQAGLGEEEKLADRFIAGQTLNVWVLREPNRKGNVQLTLVKPD